MVMFTYGDILQSKVDKLLGDISGVKIYIDNIMVLNKGKFEIHIDKIRVIFDRLRKAVMISNNKKCSLGLNAI